MSSQSKPETLVTPLSSQQIVGLPDVRVLHLFVVFFPDFPFNLAAQDSPDVRSAPPNRARSVPGLEFRPLSGTGVFPWVETSLPSRLRLSVVPVEVNLRVQIEKMTVNLVR